MHRKLSDALPIQAVGVISHEVTMLMQWSCITTVFDIIQFSRRTTWKSDAISCLSVSIVCHTCQKYGSIQKALLHSFQPGPPLTVAPSWPRTPRSRWCRCLRRGEVNKWGGRSYTSLFFIKQRPVLLFLFVDHRIISPSSSTSSMMASNSSLDGFCPSILITVPNSLVLMSPPPSVSNMSKAALNSEKNQLA